jgi:hypothetical protein
LEESVEAEDHQEEDAELSEIRRAEIANCSGCMIRRSLSAP